MAKQLDKIVVVDVESTCWEGKTPEGQVSEIIEIGICLLDVHTFEISDNRGILIQPQHSEVSDFCLEELIGLSCLLFGILYFSICESWAEIFRFLPN